MISVGKWSGTSDPDIPQRLIGLYSGIALVFWTLVVGISLALNIAQERREILAQARIEAKANLNKDLSFRRWATRHGGLCVPPTEETPPNPYLEVPDRDVTTTRGRCLTLMNPAYAMRQMIEQYSADYGIRGRITSLILLNPKNAPDAWERAALEAFAKGSADAVAVAELDGVRVLRYMRPMRMEAGCLKCHAVTGVKVGEIRGGISVAVPLAPYDAQAAESIRTIAASHGGIWLVGVVATLAIARRGRRVADQRAGAAAALRASEKKVRELNEQLERRVAERTAEIESACRDLESYSYSTSHDLRAPLRAMNGYAHILLEADGERLSETGREMLQRIVHNSNKMERLIDDLLDYEQASRGTLHIGPVDMEALARETARACLAGRQGTAVEIGLLGRAEGDARLLRLLLTHLVDNAIKFSAGAERPRIEIGVAEQDGMLRFHVRDNGAGFDMAYAGKLFGMFQRLHAEGEYPGTGGGLAIARRIVERHRGRIWAEAAPGQGATFYFTLPPAP